jgi:hypothetical protein
MLPFCKGQGKGQTLGQYPRAIISSNFSFSSEQESTGFIYENFSFLLPTSCLVLSLKKPEFEFADAKSRQSTVDSGFSRVGNSREYGIYKILKRRERRRKMSPNLLSKPSWAPRKSVCYSAIVPGAVLIFS